MKNENTLYENTCMYNNVVKMEIFSARGTSDTARSMLLKFIGRASTSKAGDGRPKK